MLNYKISIPVEKIEEHYTYGMFDSDYISGELTSWIKENIRHEWNWDAGNAPDTHYYLNFRFEDKKDAMAFKLRWL
ncbi:hypothetical protein LCGC14_1082410 [marine sediment metagenome]|uniref:Uncharacterized protein n=1 Tax=marine sediment metagenome TaxID=412755 RepID=A0A0F9N2F4_9ZZZZ